MIGDQADPNGAPHVGETAQLLAGLHFSPRASLGPEIAGRAGRGEQPRGGQRSSRLPWLRSTLGAAAAVMLMAGAGILTWKMIGPPVLIDSCCQDLDGGGAADDGFMLEARGRKISRLRLYEDRDGSRTLSAPDLVRFARGAVPALGGGGEARTTRICCSDLDGEGPPDDGVLIMSKLTNRSFSPRFMSSIPVVPPRRSGRIRANNSSRNIHGPMPSCGCARSNCCRLVCA